MRYLVAALTGVSICCSTTHAEVLLDQENVGSCCVAYVLDYPEDYIAQTFTVRNGGQLVGVAVQVSLTGYQNDAPVTDDLYVSLMRTDSLGLPAVNEILATRTIDRHYVPDDLESPMTEVDFSHANLRVRAGDVLAIALSSSHTYYAYQRVPYSFAYYQQYDWHLDLIGPHPGGEFYVYSPRLFGSTPFSKFHIPDRTITRDAGFRVFIDPVPEPSIMSMVGIACVAKCWLTRRRHRHSLERLRS